MELYSIYQSQAWKIIPFILVTLLQMSNRKIEIPPNSVGSRLMELIEREGIKPTPFANSLKIDPSQFTKILKGELQFPFKKYEELSSKYDVNIDWLLSGNGDMNRANSANAERITPTDSGAIIMELIAERKELIAIARDSAAAAKDAAAAAKDSAAVARDLSKRNENDMARAEGRAVTANDSEDISLAVDARFAAIRELIADIGMGKRWESVEEAAAAVDSVFYGAAKEADDERIQHGKGKGRKANQQA